APPPPPSPPPPPPPARPVTVPPPASPFAEEDFDLGPSTPGPAAATGGDDDLWSEVNLRGSAAPIIDPAVGEDNLWGSLADTSVLEEQPAAPPRAERPPAWEMPRPVEPAPPPPRETPAPAVAIDQAEIERLVASRLDAAVRQALEPLVASLARALVEDVAWQVVPDLAEAMIRAEIERVTRDADRR
ncbi:MAG TPA: hypothetical protein VI078_05105, partial [bacterium]